MTQGGCFSLNSGFTKILFKPEKLLYVFELFSFSPFEHILNYLNIAKNITGKFVCQSGGIS